MSIEDDTLILKGKLNGLWAIHLPYSITILNLEFDRSSHREKGRWTFLSYPKRKAVLKMKIVHSLWIFDCFWTRHHTANRKFSSVIPTGGTWGLHLLITIQFRTILQRCVHIAFLHVSIVSSQVATKPQTPPPRAIPYQSNLAYDLQNFLTLPVPVSFVLNICA